MRIRFERDYIGPGLAFRAGQVVELRDEIAGGLVESGEAVTEEVSADSGDSNTKGTRGKRKGRGRATDQSSAESTDNGGNEGSPGEGESQLEEGTE